MTRRRTSISAAGAGAPATSAAVDSGTDVFDFNEDSPTAESRPDLGESRPEFADPFAFDEAPAVSSPGPARPSPRVSRLGSPAKNSPKNSPKGIAKASPKSLPSEPKNSPKNSPRPSVASLSSKAMSPAPLTSPRGRADGEGAVPTQAEVAHRAQHTVLQVFTSPPCCCCLHVARDV